MRLIDADALNGYKFGLISPYAQNLFHKIINEAPTIDYKRLLEQELCTEQWKELKEIIIELRDNGGTATQQEVCKFLLNMMFRLEKKKYSSEKQVNSKHDDKCQECEKDWTKCTTCPVMMKWE